MILTEVPFAKIKQLLKESFCIYNKTQDEIAKINILEDGSIDTTIHKYIISKNNYPEFLNKTVSIKIDHNKDLFIELVNWHEDTHSIYISDQDKILKLKNENS